MTKIEILLVEDNTSDAEMTIEALREKNLTNNLLHVKDGAQALDFLFSEGKYALKPLELYPKVVFLDVKLPKVNGIEVLQKLRSNEQTKMIPVVMLTSSKVDRDIKKCYELGVNSYVVKPVDFDEFKKVISELGIYWMIVNQPFVYT